ncbi:hypothetical protein YC2023_085668 [Brassica napus]
MASSSRRACVSVSSSPVKCVQYGRRSGTYFCIDTSVVIKCSEAYARYSFHRGYKCQIARQVELNKVEAAEEA